jgi:hypothetical protein
VHVDEDFAGLAEEIAPHSVRVYLSDAPVTDPDFLALLDEAQAAKARRTMP